MSETYLPTRVRNQAMAATLRLWHASEFCDRATMEAVLKGLRALDAPTRPEQPAAQREVDGVIARWRTAQIGKTARAC